MWPGSRLEAAASAISVAPATIAVMLHMMVPEKVELAVGQVEVKGCSSKHKVESS